MPLRLLLTLLIAGCPESDTGGKDTDTSAYRYHPDGWSDPTQHSVAAKYQDETCTDCHGDDLGGGTSGQSCDSCHPSGWRTDCTFCHGGDENTTGAPPTDIDNQSTDLSFPEHTVHVTETIHPAWDCVECHEEPEDVLSDGHIFIGDTTAGVAEVTVGEYSAGTCSNLYCHGDTVTPGTVSSGEVLDCGGCHGSAEEPGTLSAAHPNHLAVGVTCEECHADPSTTPELHVDGLVEIELLSGMTYAGDTCTGTCHDVEHEGKGWTDEGYHPDGWDAPEEHGIDANIQDLDCTACHGEDLAGGTSGVSCDVCHAADWRTDCTYCHGGEENSTGAPPQDIDGGSAISFPEHSAHVTETIHAAWDCVECHVKPEDVLSDGHLFIGDTTAGAAEVTVGAYSLGTCSNLYCHGDGQTTGSVSTGESTDCASCHGTADAPGTLSTVHTQHLDQGATCDECHSDPLITAAAHVDGTVDTEFASGMVLSGGTCTGTCHDVEHGGSTWTDGGFHPVGWDAADVHGLPAKLQEQDCTTCHSDDLAGGTSGESCDSCHVAGWRTNCTYCHGGDENSTGAPPADIDGGAVSFPEHSAHVEETIHAAWDCVECHQQPEDVLSEGHVFIGDTTAGVAEVTVGAYSAGTCSNLYCHGDGVLPGDVSTGETTDCASCHGTADAPGTLSTVHAEHLDQGATCDECHADPSVRPALHVDGAVDTEFSSGMVFSAGTCTGTCHDVEHGGSNWVEGGFHEAGWEEAEVHGLPAKLQEQDCTTCHGDDLAGGTSGENCDSCHQVDWRTNCTYCHGGDENGTGAPPADIDGGSAISFPEHSAHVEETNHAAWECSECHDQPEDVLADGHVFIGDTTPGVAEVTGTYAAGTCSNLYCHGDGQTPGDVTTGETTDCASCHGDAAAPGTLSTVHAEHLDEGATCDECHSDPSITPALHVNELVDTEFASGMVFSGGTCTGTCHDVTHGGSTWTDEGFHPEGWDEAGQHGLVANLQEQDCTTCHGDDLAGGRSGESCDECHTAGWRTNCTYCHGGVDNPTGAPPTDIDGETAFSFPEHTVHVEETIHAAWDCVECHTKPTDVLSDGHVFIGDTTPGEAEVTVAYSAGTCSNLYCHGDGVNPGDVSTGETTDCESCHSPATFSTVHDEHLGEGATCDECHSDPAVTPTLHVDRLVETDFSSGMVYSGGTCTGTCHDVRHGGSSWVDDAFHPAGWDAADEHGLTANLLEQDCTRCHGDDLAGGTSGQGCDDCHTSGWRTDCTYCHGGVDNPTGAPPSDIDGSSSALSFDEHTTHVEELDHLAYDCTECHNKPTDVLSSGHVFVGDTTPGAAELDFTAGLSSAGSYAGAGTCSNLYCHGNGDAILGSITTGTVTTCTSCHGGRGASATMSGQHTEHLGFVAHATCDECHAATASSSTTISTPANHVDGTPELSFPSGMVYTAGRCTGTCHSEIHSARRW